METEAAKWGLETLVQYGAVGFGWPMAVYLFIMLMREKDGRREDQIGQIDRYHTARAEMTDALNRVVTVMEAKR